MPVVGATPALAGGTDGIEPASEAERANAARPEALAPWTQGEAGPMPETPPQESRRGPEPPPRDLKGRAGYVAKRLDDNMMPALSVVCLFLRVMRRQ